MSDNTPSDDAAASSDLGQATSQNGTFLPLMFGGAVAVALGFFAAQLDWVEAQLGLEADRAGLQEVIEAQAAALQAQSLKISELKDELQMLAPQIEALSQDQATALAGLQTDVDTRAGADALTALVTRVETLEKQPMTDSISPEAIAAYEAEFAKLQAAVAAQQGTVDQLNEDAVAAYEDQLARLQGAVDQQQAEIAALIDEAKATEAEAEREAQVALARTAMTRIITAVESGTPFSDALQDLEASGGAEVPDGLRAVAADGVPTLPELQREFPDAARASLSAARAEAAKVGGGGIGAFLERRLGVRSIEPQEGDDPDAVLSRAEAAVQSGDLTTALVEIAALPDDARGAISEWISRAETREAATGAADSLMSALGTN